ncbi:MAG: ABC transporter substrate-binding protein [Hyphomicrobiaceae bacterium]|nr:ABC transporter substrate-binding protein [Hyphomicrobiaceae bacterium]
MVAWLAVVLAVNLAVQACAVPVIAEPVPQLPERIRAAGTLVIGTYPNYPPIVYKNPHTMQLIGFDIELGEAIAAELGLRVEWSEVSFAQMIPSLKTGRIDMVMAFMADTPKRRATLDFVDYLRSEAVVLVRKNESMVGGLDDLCGKRVGASRSTTWPADLAAWSAQACEGKGRPPVDVVGTEGSFDARMQVKMGRLDGALLGSETIGYFDMMTPSVFRPVGAPFAPRLVGMPFLKTPEGTALRDCVKRALDGLQASGVYDRLVAKHKLERGAIRPITINGGT